MKEIDWSPWQAKTAKINADTDELAIGTSVIDLFQDKGIVVKIEYYDGPDMGTIYVWQSERTGYGLDNCEHYHVVNWRTILRPIIGI
jgi:hypothetical protein